MSPAEIPRFAQDDISPAEIPRFAQDDISPAQIPRLRLAMTFCQRAAWRGVTRPARSSVQRLDKTVAVLHCACAMDIENPHAHALGDDELTRGRRLTWRIEDHHLLGARR